MTVNVQKIAATFGGANVGYNDLVQKYGTDVAKAVVNIAAVGAGKFGSQASTGAASTGTSALTTIVGDIPIANDGDVITADYHNSLLVAVMALVSALGDAGGAQGGAQGDPHAFTWGNNSHLNTDQGGSIELGGDLGTAGTGTPYIDFHFKGETQDYNARIINDDDGQLSVYPIVGNPPSQTSVLAVHGERGIRQERLYISGGTRSDTWSSISFNAHHYLDANGNVKWFFPDSKHPAVSIEMDAAPGHARFQIWATTTNQPGQWPNKPLFDLNGDTGDVTVGGTTIKGGTPELDVGSIKLNGSDPQLTLGTVKVRDNGITVGDANGAVNAANVGATDTFRVYDANHNVAASIDKTGAVSASIKQFVIDHPLQDDRHLVHAALEGPEHSVFYRGEGKLQDGRAKVELPEYFEALCSRDGRSVQVTPRLERANERPGVLGVTAVHEGQFTVVAAPDGPQSQRFYWEVKGVRKDVDGLDAEPLRSASPLAAPLQQ